MTKKDYIAIAKVIAEVRKIDCNYEDACDYITVNLADVLMSDNPKFDRRKFLFACGLVREEG